MQYRAEIDGLRALAVVPVVLFHAGLQAFGGGFVGVDVFFVISGYLITTLILNALEKGNFRLATFYERRARRILPALFLVSFSCIPFAWIWLLPRDMADFSQSLMALAVFSSNILFWHESGYFETAAELKPLLHTWSLAIEEQYYVLFPLVLMLTWRFAKRWILAMIVILGCLSLAVAQWDAFHEPRAGFYLLPARGWELAIGGAIALYLKHRGIRAAPIVNQVASAAGIGLILLAVFSFNDETPFPSLYALVPTVGAALIILFAAKGTLVQAVLSSRLFVGIGLISYSVYLWHYPLFAFARYRSISEFSWSTIASLCVVTFALAYLSWRYVETPFRNRNVITRKTVVNFGAVGAACLLSIGIAGNFAHGFPSRRIADVLHALDYEPDNSILQDATWQLLRHRSGNAAYGPEGNAFDETLWFDPADARAKLLLVGNSHSKDIYNVLTNSAYAGQHFELARYGAQIGRLDTRFFDVPNYRMADVVMIVSRFSNNDLEDFDWFVSRALEDGKKIVLVRNIFEFDGFTGRTIADNIVRKYIRNDLFDGSAIKEESDRAYYENYVTRERRRNAAIADARIDSLKERFPDVIVLDRMDYACNARRHVCYSIDDTLNKFYFDYGHHSLRGAEFFGHRVDQVGWLAGIFGDAAG